MESVSVLVAVTVWIVGIWLVNSYFHDADIWCVMALGYAFGRTAEAIMS